jgi:hypothetical protein
MKKTLIIYGSTEPEHKIFAESMAQAIGGEIDIADFFDIEKNESVSIIKRAAQWIEKYLPGLWSVIANLNISNGLVKLVEKPLSRHLDQYLAEGKYEMVIAVQEDIAILVGYLKSQGWYPGKVVFAPQDLFVDSSWNIKGVDLYAVPFAEQKEELDSLGVPYDNILATGLNIPARESARGSVGALKKVLVLYPTYQILTELQHVEAELVVVYDQDEQFKADIEKDFGYHKGIVLVPVISEELYVTSDLIVTPPIPIVVAKALGYMKPVIVSQSPAAKDLQNYAVLRDKSLVFPDFIDLRGEVVDELTTGTFQRALLQNSNVSLFVQHGNVLKDLLNRS